MSSEKLPDVTGDAALIPDNKLLIALQAMVIGHRIQNLQACPRG